MKGSPTWYHLTHCVQAPEDILGEEKKENGEVQRTGSLQGGNSGPSPSPPGHDRDDADTAEFPVIFFPEGAGCQQSEDER